MCYILPGEPVVDGSLGGDNRYTQASTSASRDVGIELRVQVSLKALVNAFSITWPCRGMIPFQGHCKDSDN